MRDAARIWRNPELYDHIQWDKNTVIEYYGKDLSPEYIPDGLTAANGNGTARVIVDKSGNIVEDTVGLNFYHVVAEQMEAEEVVKVVSSIIYGEEVIVDK